MAFRYMREIITNFDVKTYFKKILLNFIFLDNFFLKVLDLLDCYKQDGKYVIF